MPGGPRDDHAETRRHLVPRTRLRPPYCSQESGISHPMEIIGTG